MDNIRTSRRLPVSFSILIFALFLVVLLVPFYRFAIAGQDYAWHYSIATELRDSQFPSTPHILYHFFIIIVSDGLALDQAQASLALAVIFRVITGVFMYVYIKSSTPLDYKSSAIVVILFLLAVPVYILEPYNVGYVHYAIYHSPTQILLYVFIIPASLISLRAIISRPFKNLNRRVFFTMLSALLILAMSLSKPSYAIALLPGVGLLAMYRLVRRLPVDWSLLIFGVILPQVLILGLQYLVAYGDPQRTSVQVGFLQPLRFYGARVEPIEVLLGFILSIALPLAIYAIYYDEARKDNYFNLSWITFGIGSVWSFFFYEDGPYLNAGNFSLTASSALFVLMFSAILFLIKHYSKRPQPESAALSSETQREPELVKEAELS
jgi:hypothetical protein